MGCLQQVVDLQKSEAFQGLGVQLLSLSPDTVDAWRDEGGVMGISSPMLSDTGSVAYLQYGARNWMMASNEPGHTFILVDGSGTVVWVRDYGAPENGGLMYVPPDELVQSIQEHLDR
jgi:peroxiredoxin Q/BCP